METFNNVPAIMTIGMITPRVYSMLLSQGSHEPNQLKLNSLTRSLPVLTKLPDIFIYVQQEVSPAAQMLPC